MKCIHKLEAIEFMEYTGGNIREMIEFGEGSVYAECNKQGVMVLIHNNDRYAYSECHPEIGVGDIYVKEKAGYYPYSPEDFAQRFDLVPGEQSA